MTRALVVIPARGGSKGVPGKNLATVGGRSLVERAVNTARAAVGVSRVIVSTDDEAIAEVARRAGAEVVERPPHLSTDEASSESAVLHVLASIRAAGSTPEPITVLMQCTSPFVHAGDLKDAIDQVAHGQADVVLSVASTYAFLWRRSDVGLVGVNHDRSSRPRRQDRPPEWLETGAFYVMRTAGLEAAKHRFFGRVLGQEVDEVTAIEIDTPAELALARALAPLLAPLTPIDVDALVTDFDGVHTDDRAWVDQDGRESVAVSRSDGMGLAMLIGAGVQVSILSTESNPVVAARAAKLGVPVAHGVQNKARVLAEWMRSSALDPARVAYVGNDVNDIECMNMVGWPVAVHGAHPDAAAAARLTLTRRGGDGAIRELCGLILAGRSGT